MRRHYFSLLINIIIIINLLLLLASTLVRMRQLTKQIKLQQGCSPPIHSKVINTCPIWAESSLGMGVRCSINSSDPLQNQFLALWSTAKDKPALAIEQVLRASTPRMRVLPHLVAATELFPWF